MPFPLLNSLGTALVPRLVLLANHVIASEPAALQRLRPYAGRRIDVHLRTPAAPPLFERLAQVLAQKVRLVVTPAGLLEWHEAAVDSPLGDEANRAGLTVTVSLPQPLGALRMALRRERPDVVIEGDAGLAEAVSWLMKNLRWDIEDDLARWLGASPTQWLKSIAEGVRQALGRWRPGRPPGSGAGPAAR